MVFVARTSAGHVRLTVVVMLMLLRVLLMIMNETRLSPNFVNRSSEHFTALYITYKLWLSILFMILMILIAVINELHHSIKCVK